MITAKLPKKLRVAADRATALGIALPLSLTPSRLDLLQVDSFLQQISDAAWSMAETMADCAKDERGLSLERQFIEDAVRHIGFSCVVEHVRQLLLADPQRDPGASHELNSVEREIAYGYARADIETRLPGDRHSGKHHGWWYDLTGADKGEFADDVALAVRYLTLRGLLLRHPQNKNLVRPLDEAGARVKPAAKPLRRKSVKGGAS